MRLNKEVHTTIKPELHKLALIEDINWNNALELGITMLSNYKNSDEGKLMEEKEEIIKQMELFKIKLLFIEERLQAIEKEKQTKKETEKKDQTEEEKNRLKDKFKEIHRRGKAFRANNPLRYL